MNFVNELKRRNVFRVGIAYVVASWLLLQVTDVLVSLLGLPEFAGKFVFMLVVIGFIPAMIFSWAYEVTPDGIRRESEVERSESITRQTATRLNRITIGLLVGVAVLVLVDRFIPRQEGEAPEPTAGAPSENIADVSAGADTPPAAPDQSIAVLPFVNMSADPDNEYFSDGIAEEILNVLARIPELKVAARTSAFAYKGANVNIAEIARDLNVATVLEGSVRKAGGQVRVTAQLIKADDGYHLWSSTFDRELTNIFAIQDEIANAIAEALKVTLNVSTGAAGNYTGTTDMVAYDAYLRGMNQWHLRTRASLYNAIDLFEEAIAHDPRFARAHAGLALTFAVISDYTDFPNGEAQVRTREAAMAALAIDPASIEAATALIESTPDVNEQIRFAREALAINASFATTHQWYGALLSLLGDKEAALAEMRKALELDPRSRAVNNNLAYLYWSMGEVEESERIARQLLSWAPDYASAWIGSLYFYAYNDDRAGAESALQALRRIHQREPRSVTLYLDLVFEPSRRDSAIAELREWAERDWLAPGNPSLLRSRHLAYLAALVGAMDYARESLESAARTGNASDWGYVRSDRMLPAFNCDPEVQALYDNAGLPPMTVPYPCEELLQ